MKKQLNEVKRMQKLAGLLKEDQSNNLNTPPLDPKNPLIITLANEAYNEWRNNYDLSKHGDSTSFEGEDDEIVNGNYEIEYIDNPINGIKMDRDKYVYFYIPDVAGVVITTSEEYNKALVDFHEEDNTYVYTYKKGPYYISVS